MSITRRTMLAAIPACGLAPAVPAMAAAPAAIDTGTSETTAIRAAYEQWQSSVAELTAAKDALEWLADEWRHLWPLAPEELLGAAHAGVHCDGAERDIAGRRIFRDTASLGMRLTKSFRERCDRCCFYLYTAGATAKHLAGVRARKIAGRTERTRAKNRKSHERYLEELETRLRLAREYEAETARIRTMSGVEVAKRRVREARSNAELAAQAVTDAPATTVADLRLKAEVIVHETERRFGGPNPDLGFLSGGYYLARALLDIGA